MQRSKLCSQNHLDSNHVSVAYYLFILGKCLTLSELPLPCLYDLLHTFHGDSSILFAFSSTHSSPTGLIKKSGTSS